MRSQKKRFCSCVPLQAQRLQNEEMLLRNLTHQGDILKDRFRIQETDRDRSRLAL